MKSLFENIKESLYNRELLASIELLEEQYKQLDEGQRAIDLVVVGWIIEGIIYLNYKGSYL